MAIRKTKTKQQNDIESIPELPSQFCGLIALRANINPEDEWNEIRSWIASQPKTIVEMRDAIRISADMHARARDLYDLTHKTHKSFTIKYKAQMQIWRYAALGYWEARQVKKQTTEQMIEDYILDNHYSDYLDLQERMNEIALLSDSFKALCENVYNKGVDLRKLLDSEGRRSSGAPNWMDGKRV